MNTGNCSWRNIWFARCTSNDFILRHLRFSQRTPLFWAVRLCLWMSSSRRFDGSYCHHHERSNSRLFFLGSLTLKIRHDCLPKRLALLCPTTKLHSSVDLKVQQRRCQQVASRTAGKQFVIRERWEQRELRVQSGETRENTLLRQ